MIFILDKDEVLLGVLNNNGASGTTPYFNDNYIQKIECGTSSYEFDTISNDNTSTIISVGNYIIRNDLDNNQIMFQITEVEEIHDDIAKIHVYAESSGLELLNDVVRPAEYNSKSLEQMLTYALQNTRWEVGEINVDSVLVENYTFNYENVLQAIQNIAELFDVEISERIIFKKGEVQHRYIDVSEQRGTETYKRFVYGNDIKSISRKINTDNLVTALIGIGNENLNFKGIEWLIANGDKCDKPLNQDFVSNEDALELYGIRGKHIFGTFKYETDDALTLLNKTYVELKQRSKPEITYELDVVMLERIANFEHESVRLGDTVYVIDNTFTPSLRLKARITELQTSFTDSTQDKCTISNYKPKNNSVASQIDSLENAVEKVKSGGGSSVATNKIIEYINTVNQTQPQIDFSSVEGFVSSWFDGTGTSTLLSTNANIQGTYSDNYGSGRLEILPYVVSLTENTESLRYKKTTQSSISANAVNTKSTLYNTQNEELANHFMQIEPSQMYFKSVMYDDNLDDYPTAFSFIGKYMFESSPRFQQLSPSSEQPNVYIDNYGYMYKSVSASKYKLCIDDVKSNSENVLDEYKKILNLNPKTWYDKLASEKLAEKISIEKGIEPNKDNLDLNSVPYLKKHYGLIAEDLVDADLTQFVNYVINSDTGEREVDSVSYERVWIYLIPLVRDLYKQKEHQDLLIKEQKDLLNKQQETINSLLDRVTKIENNITERTE